MPLKDPRRDQLGSVVQSEPSWALLGPQLSAQASDLPEGGYEVGNPCVVWRSQVPTTSRRAQLPLLPRHGGLRVPSLCFGVPTAPEPLPTPTHVVPCLPALLEEQLKLLAFVHPGKGT